MTKALKIALIIFIYALLGFSREYLFESINIKLFYLWRNETDPIMDEALAFLNQYSYWTLYWLKWILTGIYTLFYLGAGLLIVKLLFKPAYYRYVLGSYAIIIAVAVITFLSGYLLGSVNANYAITRQLMEWLQSPIMMFVLIPGFLLEVKSLP